MSKFSPEQTESDLSVEQRTQLVSELQISQFQDKIWELEEIKQLEGINQPSRVVANPYTAETISEMEDMVIECPAITQFYAGALKKYRAGKPESVKPELGIIGDRIETMIAESLYEKNRDKLKDDIKTGAVVRDEAEFFFKMFAKVIPAENRPKPSLMAAAKPKSERRSPSRPRQSRNIDVVITQHGGIRVNGDYLRPLTDTQKLIILSGLAKGSGFRNVEIYRTDEFRNVVGSDKTDEQLKDIYEQEFSQMQEYLRSVGYGRLIDPNRKKHERSHYVVANSIEDLRTPKVIEKANDDAKKPIPFFETRENIVTDPAGTHVEHDALFSPTHVEEARHTLQITLAEKDSLSRSDAVAMLAEKFTLDEAAARKLVVAAYKADRDSERPFFSQVKIDGAKHFIRIIDGEDPSATESIYGAYFDGTTNEFVQKFGQVKNILPSFVNFERGVIQLEGAERALLEFFERSGSRAAISEKSIVKDIEQKLGIMFDKEELRNAVRIINTLYGREFVRCLGPAARNDAKGKRIQRTGSFQGE